MGRLENGWISFLAIKGFYRLAFREEVGKEQAPKGHMRRSHWLVTVAMNFIQLKLHAKMRFNFWHLRQ